MLLGDVSRSRFSLDEARRLKCFPTAMAETAETAASNPGITFSKKPRFLASGSPENGRFRDPGPTDLCQRSNLEIPRFPNLQELEN